MLRQRFCSYSKVVLIFLLLLVSFLVSYILRSLYLQHLNKDCARYTEAPIIYHERILQSSLQVMLESGGSRVIHKELMNEPQNKLNKKIRIAIGGAITSMGITNITDSVIDIKFMFFTAFMPSFCRTFSVEFSYGIYLAYDWTDLFFTSSSSIQLFHTTFKKVVQKWCGNTADISLHLIECGHSSSPGWAQNDAMMTAYLDGHDYFYRVNDDTVFVTKSWAKIFIGALLAHEPSNVGVVGPTHDTGKLEILTYDFVHYTHVDIFGFYYPRIFTDWFADDWISKVYYPTLMTKLSCVQLSHTEDLGRRYENNWQIMTHLERQVKQDQVFLDRHVDWRLQPSKAQRDKTKVISMSLYGNCTVHLSTVLRNCQLARILFPDWSVRVYTRRALQPHSDVLMKTIERIRGLGVSIVDVDIKLGDQLCPQDWRMLAFSDPAIDWLLIACDQIFTEKHSQLVTSRINSNKSHPYILPNNKSVKQDWKNSARCSGREICEIQGNSVLALLKPGALKSSVSYVTEIKRLVHDKTRSMILEVLFPSKRQS